MNCKKTLGAQVIHLLSVVSGHGIRHLNEIETDMVQTNLLLSEAIDKLGASFLAIHAAVVAQQEAVDGLLQGAAITPELDESLKTRHAEIERHLSAAVTGLQFQDMTSQLMGRALKRVTGFRGALDVVGVASAELPAGTDEVAFTSAVNELSNGFETHSVQLESALWKTVCQTHMESGDVELF